MSILRLILFFGLMGCTHKQIDERLVQGEEIFPPGTYQQQIEITVESSGKKKDMEFSGVVLKSPDQIVVTGLAMGITAFRIHDDRKGSVKKEVYLEAMKSMESYFDYFYSPLKKILLLENPNRDSQIKDIQKNALGLYKSLTLESSAGRGFVEFDNYDIRKVPGTILLKTPYYQLRIENIKYTLKSQ